MPENLKEKAEEQIQQRSENPKEEVRIETPLEEVRRISEEAKRTAEKTERTVQRLEELHANLALGGKTSAGQPMRQPTEEEKAQEQADKILNVFK